MKLRSAAVAVGLLVSMLAAPTSAGAAARPDGGFCSYTYSIWFGNPGPAQSVNLSAGSSNCTGPIFVQLARLLPGGGKQTVAYGNGMASYLCQGTTINTYQSVGTLNGEVLTMANVACG
jgi:hypothetical protein